MNKLLSIMGTVLVSGCATLTEDPMNPIAMSFSDGSSGTCKLQNKRGVWTANLPTTTSVRKSDDGLVYDCETENGTKATGMIPSEMGGKIIASAVFIDFGITDAITDKHRRYASNYVIPVANSSGKIAQVATTPLSDAASSLRATSESKKDDCKSLKSIMKGSGGAGNTDDFVERAMNQALNEAARAGADAYYVVDTDLTEHGASVLIEALKCDQSEPGSTSQ